LKEQDLLARPITEISSVHKKIADDLEKYLTEMIRFHDSAKTFRLAVIEDCMLTAEKYERSRIYFDVAKNKLKAMESRGSDPADLKEAESRVEVKKEEFQQLGDDVVTKMILMLEKRSQILQEHLRKYHTSLHTYFSQSSLGISQCHSLEARHFLKKDYTDEFKKIVEADQ